MPCAVQVGEARFSMEAEGEDTSGYSDDRPRSFERGCLSCTVFFKYFLRRRRPIEFVGIGFMPARFNLGKLFLALQKLIDWIKR